MTHADLVKYVCSLCLLVSSYVFDDCFDALDSWFLLAEMAVSMLTDGGDGKGDKSGTGDKPLPSGLRILSPRATIEV